MKELAVVILLFMLSGCAIMNVSPSGKTAVTPTAATQPYTFASADAIRKLMLGVSREEALALIGRTTTTGYELKGQSYKPVTVANPYRSQKITKGEDVYVVDY